MSFVSATAIQFRLSASVFKELLQKVRLTVFSKMLFFSNNCNSQEDEPVVLYDFDDEEEQVALQRK